MKIVCDNCATKYSIADEKVRGKVFKIRCKKCSHIIVVRGNDGAGAPQQADAADGFPGDEQATTAGAMPSPSPAGSGGGESVWHLVVDREQVGPLTPQEVRGKFAAGEVDVETYAWREGFADWLRLGSIEDFRDLGQGAPAASSHDEGATRRTDAADLFASASAQDDSSSDSATDLFGNGGAPAPAPSLAPEVFSSAGSGGLFGAPDEAPAPAARPSRTSSPGFSQPASAAPMGGLGGESTAEGPRPMAGQRNENSVLFSLNNLQALASGGSNGPSPSAAKPGVDNRPGFANSQTEGSGLIDIRAMAASTLAAGPSTGSSSRGDDGPGFSAAPIFSPMAAPILMPAAPSGPPKWMWAILGVGVLAVLGIVVVGVLILTRKPEPVVATNLPQPQVGTPGLAPVAAAPGAPKAAAGTPEPTAAKPEDKPAVAEKTEKAEKHVAKADKADKHAAADKGTKVARAESPVAAAPVAAAPEPAKKKKGGDALDALLDGASPEKSAPAPKHVAKEEPAGGGDDNLPDQLDKGAIVGGMGKVKGRVAGCYDQFKVPGMASVSVTIGKSGSVSSATVSGAFAGTPTGSCVEKAVKSASFPKFKGAAQTINYPFMLR